MSVPSLNRAPTRLRLAETIAAQGKQPSLDSASTWARDTSTGWRERIDIPMRAFTGGYYVHLKAMYDYMGIRYREQRFLFSFLCRHGQGEAPGSTSPEGQYFIQSSNNHQLPPWKPAAVSYPQHLLRLALLLVCYTWFAVCCCYVPARQGDRDQLGETFAEYLDRIWLPRFYVQYYLLPLMSAVSTCSHHALLAFPAVDVVDYKGRITAGKQFTVTDGIKYVEQKLADGLKFHFSAQVAAVQPEGSRTKVCWEALGASGDREHLEKYFDRVVLAVPPNVVGAIFEPLRREMALIPTVAVETVVHTEDSTIDRLDMPMQSSRERGSCKSTRPAHIIHLRTLIDSSPRTQATHMMPSGVLVTTCPATRIASAQILQTSTFTRVLRTPYSRRTINRIFALSPQHGGPIEKPAWRNGDADVWVVGGWCWDGMVLLEGCVVSAVRVARAFDVRIPWEL